MAWSALRRKRRRRHPVVADDLRPRGMVQRVELREVEVRGFPELLGEVERQLPARRAQLIAGDDEPFARVRRRLVHAVVEETERARAERVGDEVPARPVEGVEEGTGALELLDFLHDRTRRRIERVLRDPVGPDDPQHVGPAARTEAYAGDRTRRPSDRRRGPGPSLPPPSRNRSGSPSPSPWAAPRGRRRSSRSRCPPGFPRAPAVRLASTRARSVSPSASKSTGEASRAAGSAAPVAAREPTPPSLRRICERSGAVTRRSRSPSLSKSKRSGAPDAEQLPRRAEGSVSPVHHDHESVRRAGDEIRAPVRVEVSGREPRPGSRGQGGLPALEPPTPQVVEQEEPSAPQREDEVGVAVTVHVGGHGVDRRGPGRETRLRAERTPGSIEVVAQDPVGTSRHVDVEVSVGIEIHRQRPVRFGYGDAAPSRPTSPPGTERPARRSCRGPQRPGRSRARPASRPGRTGPPSRRPA